jgi:hypothetical protein
VYSVGELLSGRLERKLENVRCVGCGKVIDDGSKAKRTADGRVGAGAFAETKEWGVMHEGCFDNSIESPASTLAKIRKLAKATTVTSSKKAAKSAKSA